MALFTSLMVATFIGIEATFFTAAVAFGLNLAVGMVVSLGINYVAQALSGNQAANQDNFGTQGTLASGGDVPRSFGLGNHMTAGSLVYANTYGVLDKTPNAYLVQVIAVSDLPGEQLIEVWVGGEKVTLLYDQARADVGIPVGEYRAGSPHDNLWIKYYDGTQTAADDYLVTTLASSPRPYDAGRIGKGVCYAICTALIEDNLFTGFPTFQFVLSGIPLYDPSKDSTNGGAGSHRYSDPSTWGGDGDLLPPVQAYNVLRGIRYNGAWLYGLQNMAGPARLPAANWNAQIAKCRATVTGVSGLEPFYRSGGQINVDTQPANAIDAILTACQGRLSEIGGFYKIHLGAPDSPAFSWTDDDLLSSEQQTFKPFFSLADSVNGIQGTYPDPLQGWQTATAPALYRTDLEVRDGQRRLMAAPAFDFVPYAAQVQRLQKSGIEEAQRARTHVLPLPPAYSIVEPGDVGSWTSARNGYADKSFRVDSVVDRANLDVIFNITEVDPADYDWNHATDYTAVATGTTINLRPAAQGVVDWTAEGTVLYDADGLGRHPAIRITWDGTLPGLIGIQYEVRLKADLSDVCKGRSDQLAAGALIITQGLIPLTAYQVHGQYIPSAPRAMLWSDWIDVVTPDVVVADLPAWITQQVTGVMDLLNDRLMEVEQRLATVVSTNGQRNWLDTKDVRSQLSSRSDAAFAEIAHVESVSTAADAAMAGEITTISAQVSTNTANISTNATAIATLDTSTSSEISTLSAQVGTNTANITTNATAIATLDGFAAAQYSVTLDVNNYATGFELINGGPGVSATIFTTDKFQIASPGVTGGGPVPVFTVGTVGGVAKVGMSGSFLVDGSVIARNMAANSITANNGAIAALAVKSLNLADTAVTVASVQNFSVATGATPVVVASINLSVDTTGLTGKTFLVYASAPVSSSSTAGCTLNLTVNGSAAPQVNVPNGTNNGTTVWAVSLTATGGVMTVPISLSCSSLGAQTLTGTLYATTAKR